MTTPAKDRLNALFANHALPPKPQPGTRSLFEIENERMIQQQQAQSQSDKPTVTTASRSAKVDNASHDQAGQGKLTYVSDEEDDYVAACSSKSKEKNHRPQRRHKPEAGALGYAKDNHIEPLAPLYFVPEGKGALPWESGDNGKQPATAEDLTICGDGHSIVEHFCLFSLVAKFPYKYMEDPNDRVSRHFFAGGKIYARTWDLYYVHPPASLISNPLILVPIHQVQQLVKDISNTFKLEITVPPFPFAIPFCNDGTPQPVFLGTSRSRPEMEHLQTKIPYPDSDHGECPPGASPELDLTFTKWVEKCERALAANKKSKSAQKKKKHQKHSITIQEQGDQMKRAQRYLGLRPRMNPVIGVEGLSWDEQLNAMSKQKLNLIVNFLEINNTAPYGFDSQPVIISIDVESYERNHSIITEIGVSTLDTLDLVNIAPGPGGVNWIKHIRSRHFRIKGREHLVNRDFVAGCPQAYQFGGSEFVTLQEAAAVVDSCFEWPYSVQYKHAGHFRMPDGEKLATANTATEEHKQSQKGPKQRNIVMLGHDTNTDISYLTSLGSEIFNSASSDHAKSGQNRRYILANILEALDTATLFQVMKLDVQTKSLASICADLEIDAWFLHNAGNDARYTLEALVKIVIKARLLEDEAAKKADPNSVSCIETEWEAEKQSRIDERMAQARREMLEDLEYREKARAVDLVSPKLMDDTPKKSLPIRVNEHGKPQTRAAGIRGNHKTSDGTHLSDEEHWSNPVGDADKAPASYPQKEKKPSEPFLSSW